MLDEKRKPPLEDFVKHLDGEFGEALDLALWKKIAQSLLSGYDFDSNDDEKIAEIVKAVIDDLDKTELIERIVETIGNCIASIYALGD